MKILVTGCCGFIGTNLCLRLLNDTTNEIYGIDNFTDNYDPSFKRNNEKELRAFKNFHLLEVDILQFTEMNNITPDMVIHLASIPGVRKSLEDPLYYVKNNIEAFVYLLEQCKINNIKKVIYASSSSVYGANDKIPFSENDEIVKLKSSYACSKKCMEVYGKYYNDVFDMSVIGLRFFTVYGMRGRPDMAPYMFVKKIAEGDTIKQFGDGSSYRDYTFVEDIVNGIISLINGNGKSGEIYNLGNNKPISLKDFIKLCERIVGKKANIEIIENQLGDVPRTFADITKAQNDLNYTPRTSLETGLKLMFEWMIEKKRISI